MNRIYVFSSTGTGLQIAKDIGEKLGNTEILSIPLLMKSGKWDISGETVGFVFPCYYGTMPKLVETFISGAGSVKSGYTFSIASAGSDAGFSLKAVEKALGKRDTRLDYGRKMSVATNYMNGWYYDMRYPGMETIKKYAGSVQEECYKAAEEIIKKVSSIEKSNILFFVIPNIISPNRYIKDSRPWDSEFAVTDSCNGCGVCRKSCPVDNINMKEGQPVFGGNCQRCMGCIQLCGKSAFTIKGKPMDKVKYFHPYVKQRELIAFNNESV